MSPPFRFVDPSDRQARPPPLSSDNDDGRRGRSKAQACLHRILHIIASSKGPSSRLQGSSRGLGIDLNLRLFGASFGDEEEEEEREREEENVGFVDESGSFGSSSAAAPGVGKMNTVLQKSSEVEMAKRTDEANGEQVVVGGEGDREKAEEEEEEEEEEENGDDDNSSEITNVQVPSFEKSDKERASEMQRSNGDGFLGLLVEAARLVSGHGGEDEEDETESRERISQRRELHDFPRTKADATEDSTEAELLGPRRKRQISEAGFGESKVYAPPSSPPVVRSKRGRNQVLPYRFRDSVLEPWARLSRSNPVPSKRRVGVKP